MTTFFDTSAVIALSNPNEIHHNWSVDEFTGRQAEGPVVISDIVYAEVSAGMPSQAAVDTVVQQFGFQRSSPNDAALFDAGQRYRQYRQNGGPKTNILADFFIGADARALGASLVTANPKDFRGFFSGLTIVHPNGEEVVP